MIRVLSSSNRSSNKIVELIYKNQNLTSDQLIADAFSEYFSKVATDLESNLPPCHVNPLSFVRGCHSESSLFLSPVSVSECTDIIANLKSSAEPIDTVPVKIFGRFLCYYVETLCDIINLSFVSGVYPSLLKLAVVIPIYKKGDRSDINNYRPICMLPFVSKVFERCLHTRIYSYLTSRNLLTNAQFGFRAGFSTSDAISVLTEELYSALNERDGVLSVFVDIRRAFDTVNHNILLGKLEMYGVRGPPLELIRSFLLDRRNHVKVNSAFSKITFSNIGVPQGSVLGPLLFIIYVNDLPQISNLIKTIMFADDTVLSFRGNSMEGISQTCNAELATFYDWSLANRLSVNAEKSFYNQVTLSRSITQSLPPIITLGDGTLHRSPTLKYLGVFMDEKLNFEDHIKYICKKVSKSIGIIQSLRNTLPCSTLKSLYFALVHPYLNYCNIVWGGTSKKYLEPLFILQKRAIRIINKKPFLSHTNSLFLESSILKLDDLFKFNLLIYMFRGRLDQRFIRPNNYLTRFNCQLLPEFQRLTLTQRSLNFIGPYYWNKLPSSIQSSPNLRLFKKNLKLHLLTSYLESA